MSPEGNAMNTASTEESVVRVRDRCHADASQGGCTKHEKRGEEWVITATICRDCDEREQMDELLVSLAPSSAAGMF